MGHTLGVRWIQSRKSCSHMETRWRFALRSSPRQLGSSCSSRPASPINVTLVSGFSRFAVYSTAQILFAGTIGDRDVLFAYGSADQSHEFATTVPNVTYAFTAGNFSGLQTLQDSNDSLIVFADTVTAGTFFAPVLASSDALGAFWGIGSNETLLVGGPQLVRNATLEDGTLALFGDLNSTTTPLTIIGPSTISAVTFNGLPVTVSANSSSSSILVGTISTDIPDISVPELSGWKFADSLPEASADFDDGNWTVADHTTTNIPAKPTYGDGRVLYGCDYGFCENIVLWRGHFNATGSETSVNLSINGGQAFAASVFLNQHFIGTAYGNSTNDDNAISEVDQVYNFTTDQLNVGSDNVITIVQDNMGLDEFGSTIKSARGVRGFQLNPEGNFTEWKVQGKIGGYTGFPDKVRGVVNEGGLFGEREGWHLPGFDTSSWEDRDLSSGLPNATAGVGFFVTTFDLTVPSGVDARFSFNFDSNTNSTDVPYRAYLFVNGWMMGKRVGNLGPQTKFPVHQGILEFNGTNTVAVAFWAMEDAEFKPTLSLALDEVVSGGVGPVSSNNPTFAELRS
ncbi:unnamed protein product [Peniophora sp. CBMAI 1063]|nr:unnamed protein product [Peniophora sp. CBMAI 1063]